MNRRNFIARLAAAIVAPFVGVPIVQRALIQRDSVASPGVAFRELPGSPVVCADDTTTPVITMRRELIYARHERSRLMEEVRRQWRDRPADYSLTWWAFTQGDMTRREFAELTQGLDASQGLERVTVEVRYKVEHRGDGFVYLKAIA